MKYFRLLGIMSLLVFSFYLTDRVTELAINTNPLMQNIKSNMVNYEVKSVDAIIDNNTLNYKRQVESEAEMHKKMIDDNFARKLESQTLTLEEVKGIIDLLNKN